MSGADQESPSVLRIGIAVVGCSGKYLVGVRSLDVALPGRHEFPGGKCETAETPAACAVRECREETGLAVTIVRSLLVTEHEYPHGRLELSFFLCRPEDSGLPAVPSPWYWIPQADLHGLNFPEANRAVLQLLSESV